MILCSIIQEKSKDSQAVIYANYILSRFKWLDTMFGLVFAYIKQSQIVNTKNYSVLNNSGNLLFTIAQTKASKFIFIRRCLVMYPNNSLCFRRCRLANVTHLTRAPNVLKFSTCGPRLLVILDCSSTCPLTGYA
jgi:hypothetical protein